MDAPCRRRAIWSAREAAAQLHMFPRPLPAAEPVTVAEAVAAAGCEPAPAADPVPRPVKRAVKRARG